VPLIPERSVSTNVHFTTISVVPHKSPVAEFDAIIHYNTSASRIVVVRIYITPLLEENAIPAFKIFNQLFVHYFPHQIF
jgi:hypothetical protein